MFSAWRGVLVLERWCEGIVKLTLIRLSVLAEYARRTILGSEEERGRIRGRMLKCGFVVV